MKSVGPRIKTIKKRAAANPIFKLLKILIPLPRPVIAEIINKTVTMRMIIIWLVIVLGTSKR